jgi:hypothetical protein
MMVKLILASLWVCLVTLASTYAAISWHTKPAQEQGEKQKHFGGLESVRTRMISVPVVGEGGIHGYVMAQFIFTVDAKTMGRMSVKPDVFLLDEAFKAIYGARNVDFRTFQKSDLPGLSKQIGENVNKRLGMPLVDDVLIQELNYISKDNVRGGSIKQR